MPRANTFKPTALSTEPRRPYLIGEAASAYKPLANARALRQSLKDETPPPADLFVAVPGSITLHPSLDAGKLKTRITALEPVALSYYARSLPTGAHKAEAMQQSQELARQVILSATQRNRDSKSQDIRGCYLSHELSASEVQVLVYSAFSEEGDVAERVVSFLGLYRRHTVMTMMERLILPALGLSDLSVLGDIGRKDLETLLADAVELDQLLGFRPLLNGDSNPSPRRTLLELVDPVPATESVSPIGDDQLAPPTAGETETPLVLLARSRHDLRRMLEPLVARSKELREALVLKHKSVALDFELTTTGRIDADAGTWLKGVSAGAAGPFCDEEGEKYFVVGRVGETESFHVLVATNEDTTRTDARPRAEAVANLVLQATDSAARPLITWSTKPIEALPVFDAFEVLKMIDWERQPPRGENTFRGIRGAFTIFLKNYDKPIVLLNVFPLFTRWINAADIPEGTLQRRGQAHLYQTLFGSSPSHPSLPATSSPSNAPVVEWTKLATLLDTTKTKLQKACIDVRNEGRLADFLCEVVDIANQEHKAGIELLEEDLFAWERTGKRSLASDLDGYVVRRQSAAAPSTGSGSRSSSSTADQVQAGDAKPQEVAARKIKLSKETFKKWVELVKWILDDLEGDTSDDSLVIEEPDDRPKKKSKSDPEATSAGQPSRKPLASGKRQ